MLPFPPSEAYYSNSYSRKLSGATAGDNAKNNQKHLNDTVNGASSSSSSGTSLPTDAASDNSQYPSNLLRRFFMQDESELAWLDMSQYYERRQQQQGRQQKHRDKESLSANSVDVGNLTSALENEAPGTGVESSGDESPGDSFSCTTSSTASTNSQSSIEKETLLSHSHVPNKQHHASSSTNSISTTTTTRDPFLSEMSHNFHLPLISVHQFLRHFHAHNSTSGGGVMDLEKRQQQQREQQYRRKRRKEDKYAASTSRRSGSIHSTGSNSTRPPAPPHTTTASTNSQSSHNRIPLNSRLRHQWKQWKKRRRSLSKSRAPTRPLTSSSHNSSHKPTTTTTIRIPSSQRKKRVRASSAIIKMVQRGRSRLRKRRLSSIGENRSIPHQQEKPRRPNISNSAPHFRDTSSSTTTPTPHNTTPASSLSRGFQKFTQNINPTNFIPTTYSHQPYVALCIGSHTQTQVKQLAIQFASQINVDMIAVLDMKKVKKLWGKSGGALDPIIKKFNGNRGVLILQDIHLARSDVIFMLLKLWKRGVVRRHMNSKVFRARRRKFKFVEKKDKEFEVLIDVRNIIFILNSNVLSSDELIELLDPSMEIFSSHSNDERRVEKILSYYQTQGGSGGGVGGGDGVAPRGGVRNAAAPRSGVRNAVAPRSGVRNAVAPTRDDIAAASSPNATIQNLDTVVEDIRGKVTASLVEKFNMQHVGVTSFDRVNLIIPFLPASPSLIENNLLDYVIRKLQYYNHLFLFYKNTRISWNGNVERWILNAALRDDGSHSNGAGIKHPTTIDTIKNPLQIHQLKKTIHHIIKTQVLRDELNLERLQGDISKSSPGRIRSMLLSYMRNYQDIAVAATGQEHTNGVLDTLLGGVPRRKVHVRLYIRYDVRHQRRSTGTLGREVVTNDFVPVSTSGPLSGAINSLFQAGSGKKRQSVRRRFFERIRSRL